MGLFRSLKGKALDHPDSTTHPPASGPENHTSVQNGEKSKYTRSSEPHPSTNLDYAYAPPQGPPPSTHPPPYHDWESAVPDTSTLPPPPALPNLSSTHNASYSAAERGHAFVERFPMYTPSMPSQEIYSTAQAGKVGLEQPTEFKGNLLEYERGWKVTTKKGQGDCVLLSTLPMYFASRDSPLYTERTCSIYFEVRILGIKDADSAVAIGYAAKPYPGWRLPGWHRGSVGVHGDDGRRFVNDSWGGLDFVKAFKVGETVGIGMIFAVPKDSDGRSKAKTEVFFTRSGTREGSWWMDEERDAERDEGVEGLQGEMDMYPAVGCCGRVDFEVVFDPGSWMYQPI